jgi:hypothetical protein
MVFRHFRDEFVARLLIAFRTIERLEAFTIPGKKSRILDCASLLRA